MEHRVTHIHTAKTQLRRSDSVSPGRHGATPQREGVNSPRHTHAHTNPNAKGTMQLPRGVRRNRSTRNKPEKEENHTEPGDFMWLRHSLFHEDLETKRPNIRGTQRFSDIEKVFFSSSAIQKMNTHSTSNREWSLKPGLQTGTEDLKRISPASPYGGETKYKIQLPN